MRPASLRTLLSLDQLPSLLIPLHHRVEGAHAHRETGIDHQVVPGGVAAFIAGHIQGAVGNVLGSASTIEGQLLIKELGEPLIPEFIFLCGLGLVASPENRSHDRARGHAVDADAELRQLRCPDLGHLDQGGLARTINGAGTVGRDPGGTAVADDAAAPVLLHDRHDILDTQEAGAEVAHHEFVKIIGSEVLCHSVALADAGVVVVNDMEELGNFLQSANKLESFDPGARKRFPEKDMN